MIIMSRDKIEIMILKLKIICLFKNLTYYIKRSRREKKKLKNYYKKFVFKNKSSER